MRRKGMGLVIGAALALAGCGSKEDANAKNFGAAIAKAMERGNEFCLGLSIKQWPLKVWVDAPHHGRPDAAGELAALEQAGLVKGGEAAAEARKDFFGRPMGNLMTVRSYEVTATGKQFFVEKPNGWGGDFCYGKGKLGQVVRWDGPVKAGEASQARVVYTYDVEGLADWAKLGAVQRACPSVVRVVGGIGKTQFEQAVALTPDGWQATGGVTMLE